MSGSQARTIEMFACHTSLGSLGIASAVVCSSWEQNVLCGEVLAFSNTHATWGLNSGYDATVSS